LELAFVVEHGPLANLEQLYKISGRSAVLVPTKFKMFLTTVKLLHF